MRALVSCRREACELRAGVHIQRSGRKIYTNSAGSTFSLEPAVHLCRNSELSPALIPEPAVDKAWAGSRLLPLVPPAR